MSSHSGRSIALAVSLVASFLALVAYTKINDVRSLGVETDPSLEAHRTVAVRIDSEMKARIEAQRSALRAEP